MVVVVVTTCSLVPAVSTLADALDDCMSSMLLLDNITSDRLVVLACSDSPSDCRDCLDFADELEDLDNKERRERFFFVAVRGSGGGCCGSSSPPWGSPVWGLALPLLNRLRREKILLLRRLDLLPDPIVSKESTGAINKCTSGNAINMYDNMRSAQLGINSPGAYERSPRY